MTEASGLVLSWVMCLVQPARASINTSTEGESRFMLLEFYFHVKSKGPDVWIDARLIADGRIGVEDDRRRGVRCRRCGALFRVGIRQVLMDDPQVASAQGEIDAF